MKSPINNMFVLGVETTFFQINDAVRRILWLKLRGRHAQYKLGNERTELKLHLQLSYLLL